MKFPSIIYIPATVAAGITFGGELTARDQAILLMVLWYAATHGVDAEGYVDVPDLALREALGGMKSRSLEKATAAQVRLSRAIVATDERLPDLADGVAAPLVPSHMSRLRIAGAFRWEVDPALVAGFTVEDGEPTVALPVSLLAGARCRYTATLYLRAAAWLAGDIDRRNMVKRWSGRVIAKFALAEAIEAIDYGAAEAPRLERNALLPAIDEIRLHSDMSIDYATLRAPGAKSIRTIEFTVQQQVRMAPSPHKARTTARGFGSMPSAKIIPITLPALQFTKRPSRTVVLPDEPTTF